MTAVLRRLPFLRQEDEVAVGLERVSVRPYQIIAWVSVTARTVVELPPHAPRLPVILDTGHSHHFSIQERHLADWAQLPLGLLPQRGAISVDGVRFPRHLAAVWLRPNLAGQRDVLADQPPYRLELPGGIAVYPSERAFPRLPLLGLRALVHNSLQLTVDSEQCLVNLRTPDWRTKLFRWLA